MSVRSSLSDAQLEAAVAWFEQGLSYRAAGARLNVSPHALRQLYERWRLRGEGALVRMSTGRPLFSFEFKLALVERHLAGEAAVALAEEAGLSSPQLLRNWTRAYRREGPEALRPKGFGPSPGTRGDRQAAAAAGESELEQLRHENELLRAKVAYLGKLKALREQARE